MGNPKGKNWSYEEEVALVEAWMQHSEDRCIGSNQRNMDFWEKVYNHLLKNCPQVVANGRQIGAAIAHFKKIGGATSKYHKCILAAERARTSGQSQIDVVSFASARYQATHPNNRPFGWHHCFVKMQHFVKWQHEPWDTPTDTPTEADDTPTDADADADANDNDAKAVQLSANEDASAFQPLGGSRLRPPGRNKSKKARQDSPQAAESINNLCQETKTLFTNHERLIKEHNKYKQRQEDLGIMEMNLTTMFGERRAFWEARQREVMARWNASAANEANQGTSSSGGLYTMKKAAPWNEQVDVISSDDPSSSDVEMEATTENDSKQLTNNVTMDQPTKEITFEDALIRRAEMYEEYMKQIPIPTHHGSVIPFTSWIGLGKSIKQLYGQPLHYLTNILLKQWDLLRIGGEDEYRPLDIIIHPCKAEATIWLIEEVHRRTSSHHHVANLWLSDPMHHAFVDSIFPQLRSKP